MGKRELKGALRDLLASVPRKTADEYAALHSADSLDDEGNARYRQLRRELPTGARREIERTAH